MAIVKPIKVRVGNLAGLRKVLGYVKNSDKTQDGALVFAKDLLKGMEYQQMVNTKWLFHKDTGRQYAHFVQSFDPKDDISPELAYEIGQEFIQRFEKWNDFQVVMAVHTNEPQMHAHYIVNSVSHVDGRKWQSAPQDLTLMRAISDDLCREHGLSVIEHGHSGHRSYGEYAAQNSWKRQLAQDIADCLEVSRTKADFFHSLDEKELDADFGSRSILFTVKSGTYGLKNERKCGNFKLMSYGDFSLDNMKNILQYNKELIKMGSEDRQLYQDVLLELGALHFPNDSCHYQDMYFQDIDFEGLTKLEIEILIKQRQTEALLKRSSLLNQQHQGQTAVILPCIANILEEILTWKSRSEINCYSDYKENEWDNEFEL